MAHQLRCHFPYPIHKSWGIDNGVVTGGLRDSTLFLVTFQTHAVSVGQVSESELGPPSHESLVSNQLS